MKVYSYYLEAEKGGVLHCLDEEREYRIGGRSKALFRHSEKTDGFFRAFFLDWIPFEDLAKDTQDIVSDQLKKDDTDAESTEGEEPTFFLVDMKKILRQKSMYDHVGYCSVLDIQLNKKDPSFYPEIVSPTFFYSLDKKEKKDYRHYRYDEEGSINAYVKEICAGSRTLLKKNGLKKGRLVGMVQNLFLDE